MYEGDFSFNAATGVTEAINSAFSALEVGGMKVELSRIGLTDDLDGVELAGKMVLPKALGGIKVDVRQFTASKSQGVDIDAENYLQLRVGGKDSLCQGWWITDV